MSFVKKTSSEFIREKKSGIHNTGVFASKFIPRGTRIIEYVGERISKEESERRADVVLNHSKKFKEFGSVYIFELNKKFDIDGNVPYNTARFINHSCSPNCESEIIEGGVWIIALRDILEGEELTYNYGYDIDNFDEHPCFCGSPNCVGYIAVDDKWGKLKKLVRERYSGLKVLVVYYSRTGTTRRVAEYLAEYFRFDLDVIVSDSRSGALGYVKSGYESAFGKRPPISFSKNPEDYDLVIVGSPIWAGTIASPVRSYLSRCKSVDVAAFSTLGGNKPGKTFKAFSLSVPSFKGMTHVSARSIRDNKFQNQVLEFFRNLNL